MQNIATLFQNAGHSSAPPDNLHSKANQSKITTSSPPLQGRDDGVMRHVVKSRFYIALSADNGDVPDGSCGEDLSDRANYLKNTAFPSKAKNAQGEGRGYRVPHVNDTSEVEFLEVGGERDKTQVRKTSDNTLLTNAKHSYAVPKRGTFLRTTR